MQFTITPKVTSSQFEDISVDPNRLTQDQKVHQFFKIIKIKGTLKHMILSLNEAGIYRKRGEVRETQSA